MQIRINSTFWWQFVVFDFPFFDEEYSSEKSRISKASPNG
jgi:hypothetical protein